MHEHGWSEKSHIYDNTAHAKREIHKRMVIPRLTMVKHCCTLLPKLLQIKFTQMLKISSKSWTADTVVQVEENNIGKFLHHLTLKVLWNECHSTFIMYSIIILYNHGIHTCNTENILTSLPPPGHSPSLHSSLKQYIINLPRLRYIFVQDA